MNAINVLDICALVEEEDPVSKRRKIYKVRTNPFEQYNDEEFRKKYRFSKDNMRKIINILAEDIDGDKRGGKIPPELQVLSAIRCWGRNEVQDDAADVHGLSQSTLSRICSRVAVALSKQAKNFIKMPGDEDQILGMRKFEEIAGMKQVVGAIDCTHVQIKKVGDEESQLYVNRKGYYSLNIQVVCDASLQILDIVAHWRGSTHDGRIFRESTISQRLEAGEFKGRFLGDGGYKCSKFLFTPVQNPKNHKEVRYNTCHIPTRNVVERCFGVCKSRFRILSEKMRVSRGNAKVIIIALAVLHNMAILFHESQFDAVAVLHDSSLRHAILNDNGNYLELVARDVYIENSFR